jgi:hypothetical protein
VHAPVDDFARELHTNRTYTEVRRSGGITYSFNFLTTRDKEAPISRPVQWVGRIVSHAMVGGLHHQTVRILSFRDRQTGPPLHSSAPSTVAFNDRFGSTVSKSLRSQRVRSSSSCGVAAVLVS